jgi:hypothetical protein
MPPYKAATAEQTSAEPTTAEAIAELARQLKPRSRLEEMGLTSAQAEKLLAPPPPKRWRMVECVSPETGATFTAHIVESREHKNGKITQLHKYKHPAGACTPVQMGGLVPDGFQILRAGTSPPVNDGEGAVKHDFTTHYLQWRWETFYQADLRRVVGAAFSPYLCVRPDDFATPWEDGKVRAFIGVEE